MTILKTIMGVYGAVATLLFILTIGDFLYTSSKLSDRFNKSLKRVYVIILWPVAIISYKGRSELVNIFIGD